MKDVGVIKDLHAQCDEKFWAFVRFKQEVTMAASRCADKMSDDERGEIELILQRAEQYVGKFQAAPEAKIGKGDMKKSIEAIWKALDELILKFRVCRKKLFQNVLKEMQKECHEVEDYYINLLGLVNSAIESTLKRNE